MNIPAFIRIPVVSFNQETSEEREGTVLLRFNTIAGVNQALDNTDRTVVMVDHGDNIFLSTIHFSLFEEAFAVLESFGSLMDMVDFAAERNMISENIKPGENREAALQAAQRAASKKVN